MKKMHIKIDLVINFLIEDFNKTNLEYTDIIKTIIDNLALLFNNENIFVCFAICVAFIASYFLIISLIKIFYAVHLIPF
jgi:hypothetical protein